MKTNQAFIKAYRQDPPETAPARPARTAAGRPHAAVFGTSVQFVSAAVDGSTSANTSRTSLPILEAQSEVSTDWPTCDSPFGRIERIQHIASIGKRPLSTFTAQPQRPVAVAARQSGDSTEKFQPATMVASFTWPSVCRAICQKHAAELDRVAELLIQQAGQGRSLIGVIGQFPKLGTTTTILCVAARLAARRRRAIIVEGNFLAPRLAGWLDATPTAWWQDVLARGVPTADAVVSAVDDNLDLLPLDAATADPLQLAASLQTSSTAVALRKAYDLVLVDLGPFFDADSQPIALELVRNLRLDAAVAVAGPGGADPRDVATIAKYLGDNGCDLLGTIENRTATTLAASH